LEKRGGAELGFGVLDGRGPGYESAGFRADTSRCESLTIFTI